MLHINVKTVYQAITVSTHRNYILISGAKRQPRTVQHHSKRILQCSETFTEPRLCLSPITRVDPTTTACAIVNRSSFDFLLPYLAVVCRLVANCGRGWNHRRMNQVLFNPVAVLPSAARLLPNIEQKERGMLDKSHF